MKINIGIIIAVIALLIAGIVFIKASIYSPDNETSLVPQENQIVTTSIEPTIVSPENIPTEHYPQRFSIPKLSVDTEVQSVGIKDNGNMANPTNFTDVGWFKLGVAPGYIGSSVVAGHVDNGLGRPGVFYDLHKLKIGDSVYVEREDGVKLQFKVTNIASYPYDDAPLKDIFARSDKARLNLITCIGDWIKEEKNYTERLVVYTELVE